MPHASTHHGRKALTIGNDVVQAVLTPGGGHLAALRLAACPVNPLWEPPWPSIEPGEPRSPIDPAVYGEGVESRLLASILGHNLCLDLWGGPSEAEAKVGLGVHGEAPVLTWQVEPGVGRGEADGLTLRLHLPVAQLDVVRRVWLLPGSSVVHVEEQVTNRLGVDRPIGWCQHVTLGRQFLEPGPTRFDASVTRGVVFPEEFGGNEVLARGQEFAWPLAPRRDGGQDDLRLFPRQEKAGDFTALLTDPAQPWAWFSALNPRHGLLVGYVWQRADFPWLGNWEENRSRTMKPWDGQTVSRGMEFANQPMPVSRQTVARYSPLLGQPTLGWIAARATHTARYAAVLCVPPAGAGAVETVTVDAGAVRIRFDRGTWQGACAL